MPTEFDLMQSGRLGFVEVVEGNIVTLSPNSYKQNLVAGNVHQRLYRYTAHGIWLRGHMSYVLRRENDDIHTLRLPDVSYMREMPDFDYSALLPTAPVLAVKVVAAYDSAGELETYVTDYLQAGTQQVWLLYIDPPELHQYTADDITRHTLDDTVTVTNVFPLRVTFPVRDCFVFPWDDQTDDNDAAAPPRRYE